MRIDYYELLQIDKNAEDDQIKKAYRKQALIWHPDKNQGNEKEASSKFRLIQEAYEVLSDPQERAYYDRNKNSILREDNDIGPEESLIDVKHYFSTSVFSGYGDDPRGFYSVYRNLFDAIREQELQASVDPEEKLHPIPFTTFGTSDSDYETVKTFYAFWTNFYTRLNFEWQDQYRTSMQTNRRTRRYVDKENQKLRDAGRKEYNEDVRGLVKFIQRRDIRWKRMQDEIKAANETKAILERRRVQEQRAAELKRCMADYHEQDWMRVDEEAIEASLEGRTLGDSMNKNEDQISDDIEEEEEEVVVLDEFYCAACEKSFKNQAQFLNHEASKKHQKNIKTLRRQLLREEKEANILQNDPEHTGLENLSLEEQMSMGEQESQTYTSNIGVKSFKKKKKKNVLNSFGIAPEFESQTVANLNSEISVETTTQSEPSSSAAPKKTKKKKKDKSKKISEEYKCNVCKEIFLTRNKLFNHIKSTGHALAVDISETGLDFKDFEGRRKKNR